MPYFYDMTEHSYDDVLRNAIKLSTYNEHAVKLISIDIPEACREPYCLVIGNGPNGILYTVNKSEDINPLLLLLYAEKEAKSKNKEYCTIILPVQMDINEVRKKEIYKIIYDKYNVIAHFDLIKTLI